MKVKSWCGLFIVVIIQRIGSTNKWTGDRSRSVNVIAREREKVITYLEHITHTRGMINSGREYTDSTGQRITLFDGKDNCCPSKINFLLPLTAISTFRGRVASSDYSLLGSVCDDSNKFINCYYSKGTTRLFCFILTAMANLQITYKSSVCDKLNN